MPVDSQHPDYAVALLEWMRARDVIAGEDAVKAGGKRYLPMLDSQSSDDYTAYRSRASFFNATGRTLDGYCGLIFRRDPFVKVPEAASTGAPFSLARAFAAFRVDADLQGTSLYGYAKNLVTEVISVGRAGTLVDWEGDGTGHGENRAYASLYQAEQIINWRRERINGRTVPTMIALREVLAHGHLPGDDFFEVQAVEQIRVLKLVDGLATDAKGAKGAKGNARQSKNTDTHGHAQSGTSASHHTDRKNGKRQMVYQVELWQALDGDSKTRKEKKWVLVETRTPLRRGKPLPLIPFVFHGPRNSLPSVDKLPLSDLIAVNLDHYRLDADYKHGMHYTALPTAWVSGFGKDPSLRIGSSTVWISEQPGATAGFLEFTGDGLGTFERAMDRDEKLLAVLGSRLLEAQKRVGETAQAIELRQSGENSVLANVATSLSESLTQVLRWVYWWNSTEENPEALTDNVVVVALNTDFTTAGMDSNELREIVAAWQSGAISQDTMLELFRRGEILPDGRSIEDEVALIKAAKKTETPAQAAAQ